MKPTPTFQRLFVANRGEVAARVARTCVEMGIVPVFGVSEADRHAPYARGHETVVLGPPHPDSSYLDPARLVQAARQSRCSALHPGWGFLAESPLLASLCGAHGVHFVGPPAHVMARMGSKSAAKAAAARAGLRIIEGSDGPLPDAAAAGEVARKVGYPVLLKAESGGGGRGMRIVRSDAELDSAFAQASAEARASFGDGRIYLEKLLEGGRHVEIQLLADRYGHVVHLGERDCSVQRNHQKLVEESPAPGADADELDRALGAAVRAARDVGYVGAGTMEFLVDAKGEMRFMEMNTRLQVEHSVTEIRCGLDLVREQILVAAGHPLSFRQQDVVLRGSAIECRINAEDPEDGFRPCPGRIEEWSEPPTGDDLRIDTHVESGYEVPPFYDSLLCKLIARGDTRDEACDRAVAGLEALRCTGLPTTLDMHLAILRSRAFRENRFDTRAIPGWPVERAPKES